MFKTETIHDVKDVDVRSKMISDKVNDELKKGWDFHSALHAHKYSVILIFKRNQQYKLNEDINKGLSKVKNKVGKVVDAIKSKSDEQVE